MATIKIVPQGGMNNDLEYSKVKPTDYLDARDITHISELGNSLFSIHGVLGNEFSFTIPAVTTQKKQVRIYIAYDTAIIALALNSCKYKFEFKRANGTVLFTSTPITMNTSISQTMLDVKTELETKLTANSYTHTITGVVIDSASGYLDITINLTNGLEWSINDYVDASPYADSNPTTIYEAVDNSLTGEMNIIGAEQDVNKNLFIWSTPVTKLSSELSITSMANASGLIRCTVTAHGLSDGDSINIQGAASAANANGRWLVDFIDVDNFDLMYSTWSGTGGTATLIKNPDGYGIFGVATYNENTEAWTYVTLLRSKELNFRRPKQITDIEVQNANDTINIYFTDNYNVPRVLYYDGAFIADGMITIRNAQGRYSYGSIGQESTLILANTNIDFSFVEQLQTGGNVEAGNWRYTICLVTDTEVKTEYLTLSNPINVFSASTTSDPHKILGDVSGTKTSKINKFQVTGIVAGLFKYIELVGIHYFGLAIDAYTIRRENITDLEEITLLHTGYELSSEPLSASLVNQFSVPYLTAASLSILDKRMILSNMTLASTIDLTDWAKTILHSVNRTQTGQNHLGTVALTGNLMAEYQNPMNVYGFMGYMQNETYRFGIKGRFRNTGRWSDVYWVDDIFIDILSTNAANPTDDRRNSGLPDWNLTDNNYQELYVPYITLDDINLEYIVDGKKIRDIFDRIEVVRSEVLNPEILATGIAITLELDGADSKLYEPPNTGGFVKNYASFYSPDILYGNTSITWKLGDKLFNHSNPYNSATNTYVAGGIPADHTYKEFLGYTDLTAVTLAELTVDGIENVAYGGEVTIGTDIFKKTGIQSPFFSRINPFSSVMLLSSDLLHLTNGQIGTDHFYYYVQYKRPVTEKYPSKELTKYITTGAYYDITEDSPALVDIDVFGGDTFTQKTYIKNVYETYIGAWAGLPEGDYQGYGFSFYSQNKINSQMRRNSGVSAVALFPDLYFETWLQRSTQDEMLYDQAYNIRNDVNALVAYDATTTAITKMPCRIPYSDIKIQGGLKDSFRTFLPLNFHDLDQTNGAIVHHDSINGELFTWQPQLLQRQYFNARGKLQTSDNLGIIIGDGSVMERDGNTIGIIGSDNKFSIVKSISASGSTQMVSWINTIYKKVLHFGLDGTRNIGIVEGMRAFFLNNLRWVSGKDNPADTEGICGVYDAKHDEIIWTVRGRRTATAYVSGTTYAADTIVSHVPVAPDVLSTFEKAWEDELFVSKVGTNQGHTPISVYPYPLTIDTITGTTTLTITTPTEHLLQVNDKVKFSGIVGLSTDINGVFHTITAVPSEYQIRIVVSALTNAYTTPHGTITEVNPYWWQLVPHTDNNYYNEYTIVFNEHKNKFTSFYNSKPRIYLEGKNSYFSPRPKSDTGKVYEHRQGKYCIWYDDGSTSQSDNGYITLLFAQDEDLIKMFMATWFSTEIVPYRVDFYTPTHESFLLAADFEDDLGKYVSAIQNDILTSSTGLLNNEDTSSLSGKYIKIKLWFEKDKYQKITDMVLKFSLLHRLYNK